MVDSELLLLRRQSEQHAERVVLIGPMASSTQAWRPVADALQTRFEVVAVEYPGCGGAPFSPLGSVASLASRVRASVAALPPKPTHLVGYSFGSWVAQQIAAGDSALRSLTLIGTSHQAHPMGVAMLTHWLRLLEKVGPEAFLPEFCFWTFRPQTFEQVPAIVETYVKVTMKSCGAEVIADQMRTAAIYHEGVKLESIRVPTQLLRGAEDNFWPKFGFDVVAAAIAGCKVAELPRAAHAVLFEAPQLVTEHLLSFMAAQR
jgi:pimeloyl-ACP methyl ester carboxylesterase